jgi:hypothetical protein
MFPAQTLPRVRRCTFGNRRSPCNLNSRLLVRFVQVLSIHVDSCSYGRATPDARERIPPMGVVKRGLWAWRLFHFFNATESRYLR